MTDTNKTTRHKRSEPLFLLAVCLLLAVFFWLGRTRSKADIQPVLIKAVPGAGVIEPLGEGVYGAWGDSEKKDLLAYLAVEEGQGYGGKLKVLVILTVTGQILEVKVIDHRETPSFFDRVVKKGFMGSFQGKDCGDGFLLGSDLDGVTGATVTSLALSSTVRHASRKLATSQLMRSYPAEISPPLRIALPEYLVLILIALTVLASLRRFPYPRALRWVTLLIALMGLGFMVNRSISLISINKLLTGNWPPIWSDLYFYLLLGFLLFSLLVRGTHSYCDRICPFGATQECLKVIGGGKKRFSAGMTRLLRGVQRILALTLICLALLHLNPSFWNYEVSALLFSFFGPTWQFALLGVFLVLALFINRPWCSSLCPVRPVFDYLLSLGRWLRRVVGVLPPR